jgi:hypothetical protein
MNSQVNSGVEAAMGWWKMIFPAGAVACKPPTIAPSGFPTITYQHHDFPFPTLSRRDSFDPLHGTTCIARALPAFCFKRRAPSNPSAPPLRTNNFVASAGNGPLEKKLPSRRNLTTVVLSGPTLANFKSTWYNRRHMHTSLRLV